MFFAWYGRKRLAVRRSIRSLRARCKEYVSAFLYVSFADGEQVRQQLAIKHGLWTEKKKKSIMRAEDEFELLKTLYLSSEVTFNHEWHRVQLALIMQLAGIIGNRPAALLAVCYQHVKVTLLPDPHGGE